MPEACGIAIGTVAERTGCNVPTIRYYEEIGLLPKAARTQGGRRTYGEADLRRLHVIRRCRDLGFAIEQVRELVGLLESDDRNCGAMRDLAQRQLDAVRRKMHELRQLEVSLAGLVEGCQETCLGGATRDCVILAVTPAPCRSGCGG
jgi:DNA-binding transcriptional MerR regulator